MIKKNAFSVDGHEEISRTPVKLQKQMRVHYVYGVILFLWEENY